MTILTLHISQLVPGMIVAEDVYTSRRELILSRNTVIGNKIIAKLKLSTVKEIMVYIPKNLAVNLPISESKLNELKNTVEFKKFKKIYTESVELLKSSFMGLMGYSANEMNIDHLIHSVTNILKECRSSLRTFDMLQCMKEQDDIVYVHSMNVTLICASFASWLNFSSDDMQQLLLAGMLHDIGKMKIPQEIIHKPDALTEEEYKMVQQHPDFGYHILKDLNLDSRVLDAVLMHHERCDGSGYPKNLTSNEITTFPKIIAIADVYDAMTTNRIYRDGICPFEVIRNFENEGYQKYDVVYLIPFLKSIALAYINSTVRLSNSLTGEVVMINNHALSRPIVKVNNHFFDLSKERDLEIVSVL